MVFAVIYAENADIVATYESRDEAESELEGFVRDNPSLQDDIGLRRYENGRPAGEFEPASVVLADRLPQRHLV
jgi:hypothetical protein